MAQTSKIGTCCIGFILLLLIGGEIAAAATYKIEWSFGVTNWPNGKHFKAGDVIVFNYQEGDHTVAVVNAQGYKACDPTGAEKLYTSGNDKITIARGNNYFICDVPDHCDQGGMKILVTAA